MHVLPLTAFITTHAPTISAAQRDTSPFASPHSHAPSTAPAGPAPYLPAGSPISGASRNPLASSGPPLAASNRLGLVLEATPPSGVFVDAGSGAWSSGTCLVRSRGRACLMRVDMQQQ
ncbi:hypothetical protein EDC01DRAFT_270831 [Geopyxis carbonaria]|nr:hypothetical protein EDC01DRAFT_270831 [Geopyxis carbonaria]